MNSENKKAFSLTGNQLKIIALIAMTCDHAGRQLFPEWTILQIIGRLAFPIFAYMIAEGCHYTRNRRKYLLTMAGIALGCQLVYYIAIGSLYQCILVTFSLSVGLIYVLDGALKRKTVRAWSIAALTIGGVVFISVFLPELLPGTDFNIDYGLWGVLLPVAVYFGHTKRAKLLLEAIFLILVSLYLGDIQWYSLAALLLLALYSGQRGKWRMKNLFYIYYPLHLAVIYGIYVIWNWIC
ncbi:MAG: hypothetical protein IJ496_01240 [Ruminococcus sp.]|nr:hypothetical protein [Ruminococcus sp.]